METWYQALIDFGILWAGASFITLFGILALNKPHTPLEMLGTSATNGAIGAGVGIGVIDKLGVRIAMALAAFVGTGLLSKDMVAKYLSNKYGVPDDTMRDDSKN